jgi:alkylhydroperoxidase family enzyme
LARISLVDKDKADPYIKEAMVKLDEQKFLINLFKVMAHSPHVARNFMRLGTALLAEEGLSPQVRELAILRVGFLCGSMYEYTKHVVMGKKAGLSQEKIDNLPAWISASCFDDRERAALAYTDEVVLQIKVQDATFNRLKTFFSEAEIVKLTAAIGYYGMVSRILVAMQVELDPGEKSLLPGVDNFKGASR